MDQSLIGFMQNMKIRVTRAVCRWDPRLARIANIPVVT